MNMEIIIKNQNFVSISKGAKTSYENAVPDENSSAKNLKCDSDEVCFPETNQNTEPSSVKDDATQQNKRDDHKFALLSGKEEPNLSSLKSPKRPNCPPEDETFIVENDKRKRKRKSDYSQPEDYKGSEIGSGLEDRGNTQSNCEGNENKPHIILSFKPEQMREKRFLNETFTQNSEDEHSTAKMPDQPFGVRTSWEDCAVEQIKNIAYGSIEDLNNDISVPIRISNFVQYANVIDIVQKFWRNQEKQDVTLLVGRFSVRLQGSDLYCCPVKKDEKNLHLHYKNLSYATLKLSKRNAKNFSETIWNYIMGNHDKVESYVLTPQDATAVCAVLFSEVIRYPDMFFHNILLMHYYKSWSEFCDHHPMVTGGSWKHQSNEVVPEKVVKRKQENLVFCAKRIMSSEGKRSTLFQVTSPV
ncbi:uncharacterized protein LOC107693383 [Sinocyclocheilus anshuiensis]|uniref:uncharacterized protein LOC107693383 n=1 Tax=Sinocyclocheilus anshuiensis TaxID=1608454 RepID=UPI0007BAC0AD|nr:PREDICTED: uncharacterized protein LOC107693383 [Sinocyclocheilus anshuiensis]